jgi:hypothetical protein
MSKRDECFYIGDAQTPEEVLQNHMKKEAQMLQNEEEVEKNIAAAYAHDLLYVQSVDDFCKVIDSINELKGWNAERSYDEWTALFHTEISEAYEEYRGHRKLTEVYYNEDNPAKPEGIPIELADEVIRIMHFFARNNISLRDTLIMKLSYNVTRPYRHGGKKA